MKVEFSNVGRTKASWSIEAAAVDEEFLALQVRKRRALMSQDIEVSLNEDGTGTVFAGMRPVGDVRVTE